MNELGDDIEKSPMNDVADRVEKLYRYRPAVMAYMTRLGFSQEEARDLVQSVFVRVCQNVEIYRHEAIWGYLETVAKSVALNEIRRRHARKRHGIEVPEEEAYRIPDEHADGADHGLEKKERSEWLRGAIEKLEPPLKTVVLFYLSDMAYEEMAQTLGISLATVKSRLHAARLRLKELLGAEPTGLVVSDDQ
jgi:RNA polymerase sigma-70 factor (ECF subfamily)